MRCTYLAPDTQKHAPVRLDKPQNFVHLARRAAQMQWRKNAARGAHMHSLYTRLHLSALRAGLARQRPYLDASGLAWFLCLFHGPVVPFHSPAPFGFAAVP